MNSRKQKPLLTHQNVLALSDALTFVERVPTRSVALGYFDPPQFPHSDKDSDAPRMRLHILRFGEILSHVKRTLTEMGNIFVHSEPLMNGTITPVTDEREKLQRLSIVSRKHRSHRILERLRLEILDDILPAPNRLISVLELETFKSKHGHQLAAFRRKVEMELISLVEIRNEELRNRRLQLFKDECYDEIDELKARMRESKLPSIVFGKLCALLGPIPVIGQVPSLLNAAYAAFGSGGPKDINSPLAYAAYVRKRLFEN